MALCITVRAPPGGKTRQQTTRQQPFKYKDQKRLSVTEESADVSTPEPSWNRGLEVKPFKVKYCKNAQIKTRHKIKTLPPSAEEGHVTRSKAGPGRDVVSIKTPEGFPTEPEKKNCNGPGR